MNVKQREIRRNVYWGYLVHATEGPLNKYTTKTKTWTIENFKDVIKRFEYFQKGKHQIVQRIKWNHNFFAAICFKIGNRVETKNIWLSSSCWYNLDLINIDGFHLPLAVQQKALDFFVF